MERLCAVLFVGVGVGVGATRTGMKKPVKLIIDTDIGGGGCNDVDDVVVSHFRRFTSTHLNTRHNLFSGLRFKAVCMANALMDNGEAEILGIIQNTAPLECAGAISVWLWKYTNQ